MSRMTTKGQVTVPKWARDEFQLRPGDELEFVKDDGGLTLQKKNSISPFDKWHGFLKGETGGKRTDELIREMRGE